MNAAASETAFTPTRHASGLWSNYAIFTLCASLYLLPFMRSFSGSRIEGTILSGATRILHGQVFARDFFEVMGPGSFYWMAAVFKLFGVTFLATRICLFVLSLGTGLSLYYLSRQVCTRYQALPSLILAGTYFGWLWPAITHHLDSNFFALLSVTCLVLWHTRRKNYLLVVAGSLIGVTTLIHQPKGALLFCASAAWLWLQRRRNSAPFAAAGLLTGGSVAVVAIVLVYFWNAGALSSLFYANAVFPFSNYGGVNTVGYAHGILSLYWNPWVVGTGSKWLIGIAVILITSPLFVAALPLLMLLVGVRCRWKSVTPAITLYWLCGWALWLSEYHRRDISHLVFGSPLLIVLCIHSLTESRRKFARIAIGILAFSSICLAALNCCFVLAESAHITATRVGNVDLTDQDSAEVIRYLDDHVPLGSEILCYPYCPSYYFLSATTNPTRYSLLTYNYNSPAQFQEVVSVLDRRRVKYVIWDTTFESKVAAYNLPESQPKSANDLIVEPYLDSHYELVKDVHGIHIMERVGGGDAR